MLKFPEVKNPHIYLFGAGGTGGFALEFMARLFAASNQDVAIDIYDGDAVETKNLKRQNFTMDDLDLNKATALVKRLKNQVPRPPVFNVHTEYVTDVDDLTADLLMNTEDNQTAIVISTVDNISTRRLINSAVSGLADSLPIIAIDSGNDNQGGQVVISSNVPVTSISLLGKETKTTLPTMLALYPEIDIIKDDRDENPGLVSYCAEESDAKPQAMMANVRNGEVIASITYQVSQNQTLKSNVWTSSILDASTNGVLKGV